MTFDSPRHSVALALAAVLVVIAIVYLLMALGVRRGDMVWSGRHPRRLPPEFRQRSLLYAILLVVSAALLLPITGVTDGSIIPDQWIPAVAFVLTTFFGISGLISLTSGSTWERVLFAPVLIGAAILSGLAVVA